MKAEIFIQTRKEAEKMQREIFEDMLSKMLPKMLRAANRKEYLTTKDLRDDFGISYQLQKYYRDEGQIPFSQEGNKIWYKTAEIEQFVDDRRIEAKK